VIAEITGEYRSAVAHVWLANPAEADVVAALLSQFRDWMGRASPADDRIRSGVEHLIADPSTEYLLGAAETGAPATGVCQLRYRYGIWHSATDCWLEDLYVNDATRRSGLGRALVQAAAARARERDCARVELDVSESNPPALALYEALGFATGKDSGSRDLLMRLSL